MAHETEYCFRAEASLVSMPILCQSSAWHCITTPKDPVTEQLQWAVWGIVIPSLCICVLVVVGYFLRNYLMGKGQESPHTLKQPSFHLTPLTFPPEKLNLILISVIENKSPSGIGTTISDPACPKKHITCPPPRYSPQRPETPTEPDDLSVDYGFVGIAPKINDGGEDWNNLNGKAQKCKAENSYEKKELIVEVGHPAGVDSPDARSYLSQKSTHTRMQTHMPIHSQAHWQTEVSTLVQAQAWASVLVNQIKGSLLSYQGATKGEVSREEDRECPGLFLTKNPNLDICVPLTNLQTNEKVGMGERDGKIDGIEEEGSESEKVALMSAYASQNINNIPNSHKDQSVLLPNDYGVVLSLATANGIEDDEDEDNGSICINWDPETKKLLLPEMAMKFNKEGAMGGLKQGQEGSKYKMAGEEEKVNALKSELKLENVFVRQGSEEEARHLERWRRGETGSETDDTLTKWDLVISLDQ